MTNDWFEVAKDGSAYDAGFKPSEPRDWHGRWAQALIEFNLVPTPQEREAAEAAKKAVSQNRIQLITSQLPELANRVTIASLDDLSDEMYRDIKREFGATDTKFELSSKELDAANRTVAQGIIEAFDELERIYPQAVKNAKMAKFIFADLDSSWDSCAMITGLDDKTGEQLWIINTSGYSYALDRIKTGQIINYPGVPAMKLWEETHDDDKALQSYYKGCMEHEFGHYIDNASNHKLASDFFDRVIHSSPPPEGTATERHFRLKLWIARKISKYATGSLFGGDIGFNQNEVFAEGFARWLNDPKFEPALKQWFDETIGKYRAMPMASQMDSAHIHLHPYPDKRILKELENTKDMTIGVQFETSKENPNSFTERALGISEANKGENEFERQRRYNTFAGNKAATDSMVGAGIALIDPDGNALFVKRSNHSDHPGHWAFPGGKINRGESHIEAAERETIEETGFVPMGEYEGEIETNNPVPFKTFLKSVESQFEPEWLMEHTEHKWASLANPPSPLHPGVKQAIAKMQAVMDAGYKESEPRDEHGRWTRGSAIPKKYKTFTEYEEAMKANEPELPLNLPKESREDDWRINQLNEQDVAEEDEQDGRYSIDHDFPNMKNYEVVGPQDGEYNCIAWAFGFEDKWWNPCAYSIAEVDKVMQDYSADIKYRQGTRDFINQPPRPGRVKIAAFEKNGRFCHMTRQLPDGRWTSKFGGNLKTVQNDLTEMEGGMYGEITRLYDMPIKEFSRFRKERRHNNDMYAWLDKDAD